MDNEGISADLYDLLHIQKDASEAEIRAAYRDLSRLHHPDKSRPVLGNDGGAAGSDRVFNQLSEANRVLSDPTLRQMYDKYGHDGIKIADQVPAQSWQLVAPDEKLPALEKRVRSLVRNHEELRATRLFGLNGNMCYAFVGSWPFLGLPSYSNQRLRFSSTQQNVTLNLSMAHRLTLGYSSHVQRNSLGLHRFHATWHSILSNYTTFTANCSASGVPTYPVDGDIMLSHAATKWLQIIQQIHFKWADLSYVVGCVLTLGERTRAKLTTHFGNKPVVECEMQQGLTIKQGAINEFDVDCKANVQLAHDGITCGVLSSCQITPKTKVSLRPNFSVLGGIGLEWKVSHQCFDDFTTIEWGAVARQSTFQLQLTLARAGLGLKKNLTNKMTQIASKCTIFIEISFKNHL